MDITTLGMLALLAVLIFFMFRNNRKRQADQRELLAKLQPGARVMLNFGMYGELLSVDEERNIAVIKTLSGATFEVHRQTVARVVDDAVETAAEVSAADTSQ